MGARLFSGLMATRTQVSRIAIGDAESRHVYGRKPLMVMTLI